VDVFFDAAFFVSAAFRNVALNVAYLKSKTADHHDWHGSVHSTL